MGLVHLLLNPSATGRSQRRRKDALRVALRARGHEVEELVPTGVDQIAATVTAAVDDGMQRLVVGGGDGLLHHALPAVAATGVAVGLVAGGTGNDFARALGLPTALDAALDAALADPVPVDLIAAGCAGPGEAPAAYAASVVTGGFSGQVNERANDLRFPPGQQRYTLATLLELVGLEPFPLTLTLDDVDHELDATLFAVANSRYFGGGMAICPDADPGDGLLDVTVIGAVSRLTLARVLPTVFSGRHVDHPAVTTHRARSVDVAGASDLWADGERFTNGPFRAVSGALSVAGRLVERKQGFA